jgi:pilus assembly protein Flp/PilA
MRNFRIFTNRLRKDEEGATAIEYGLLAALIAVVLIVTIRLLGTELRTTFAAVQTELGTANADNAAAAEE